MANRDEDDDIPEDEIDEEEEELLRQPPPVRLTPEQLVQLVEREGPKARLPDGALPFHVALERAPLATLRKLLELGVERGPPAIPPILRVIMSRSDAGVIPLLVEYGFNPTEASELFGKKTTPLAMALVMNRAKQAAELVRAGADIEDPYLDARVGYSTDSKALLERLRTLHRADFAERHLKQAVTRYAEQKGKTGIPPGAPGPTLVKEFLRGSVAGPQPKRGTPNTRLGGRKTQKSTTRHRKTRRHRRR
jgi:hypothetical protein